MKKVPSKLVVKDETGKVTQAIEFDNLVLEPSEFSRLTVGIAPNPTRFENDTEYAARLDTLTKTINSHLSGWTGRGEGEGSVKRKGVEGALNMGIDLALRQVNRPQPLTPNRINELNRKVAIAWAA